MRVVGRISCYDKSSNSGLIETKRVQIKQSGFPKGILFHADIYKSFRYKDVVVFDLLETDGTYNVVNVNHSINEFNFILENFFLFSSFERSLCYGLFKDILEGKLLYDKTDIIFDFILDNDDNLYINEVNTIPGSMANYLFDKELFPYSKLIEILVSNAIHRSVKEKNYSEIFISDVLSSGVKVLEK